MNLNHFAVPAVRADDTAAQFINYLAGASE